MSAAAKTRRDAAIAADRARGLRWATIVQRHDLSERQAREVVSAYRQAEPAVAHEYPYAAVREVLDQYESLLEQFALAAEDSTHGAVRVGALKGALTVVQARFALMQATGMVPRDLGLFNEDYDCAQLAKELCETLGRFDLPSEVWAELRRRFERERPWTGKPLVV